jgi:hypothetical protein
MPDPTTWLIALAMLFAAATIVFSAAQRPLAPRRIPRQPTRPVPNQSPNRHA